MPRKSHKKSRLGCRQCKRRHLKCDETRPKCINCVTAHLLCPYEVESDQSSPTQDHSNQSSHQNSQSTTPSENAVSPEVSIPEGTPLNMLHLELMHVWSSGLHKDLHITQENYELYSNACIRHGMQHSFLMRQVLATAALSLSVNRPEQRDYYYRNAAHLQAEAVSQFYAVADRLDESNIVAAFLMTSLIGVHSFCDTFTFRATDFNSTLESLVECLNLCRGVMLVMDGWWPFLQDSELGPFLKMSGQYKLRAQNDGIRLQELRSCLTDTDISEQTRKVYEDAIHELELVYTIATRDDDTDNGTESRSVSMFLSWLVTLPKGFIEHLLARRAEALVILAYWGVLLHRRRSFWAVGQAGRLLISGIAQYLGKHWERWLAEPLAAIA